MDKRKNGLKGITLLQAWLATVVTMIGCGLLVAGFTVTPTGEIHSSVLVSFGEIMTFSGTLLGVSVIKGERNRSI